MEPFSIFTGPARKWKEWQGRGESTDVSLNAGIAASDFDRAKPRFKGITKARK